VCGRFVQTSGGEALARRFGVADAPALRPRYNVAPTQLAAAVRQIESRRRIDLLRFGLVPGWAEDLRAGARMINARAERIATAPAFRAAFRRRRCIVPADGFYEWQPRGKSKQPWLVRAADGAPLALAAVWERFAPAEAEPIESFALVTTQANDALRPIHDRMPVVLGPDALDAWLDPAQQDRDALQALLRPTALPLDCIPVSRAVNDVRHDDPSLLEPEPRAAMEEP